MEVGSEKKKETRLSRGDASRERYNIGFFPRRNHLCLLFFSLLYEAVRFVPKTVPYPSAPQLKTELLSQTSMSGRP